MVENLPNRHSVSRVLTPIALSLFLAACGSTPDQTTQQTVVVQQPVEQNAAYYLIQADQTTGQAQVDWLLLAFDSAIDEGNYELAERIMRRLAQSPMIPSQQAQWQLSRAKLLLAKDQPTDAIRQLNFQPSWVLSNALWAQYHELRSQTYFELFDPQNGLNELILRFPYLNADQQQLQADLLWEQLTRFDLAELASISSDNSELSGWISLATAAQIYQNNLASLKRRYEQFFKDYPEHSAVAYTPTAIQAVLATEIETATNTALLLPLTGKYAKQASLIRDGFLFAMLNDESRDELLNYRIINTDGKDVPQLESELAQHGSDFIVGPLQKNVIQELQQSQLEKPSPIPMLALNFPDQIIESDALCYVALSPEQEAQEAAKHLYAQGYRFPLFVGPNSNYGRRMVESFSAKWEELSDTPTDQVLFKNQRELQYVINGAFDLRNSDARIAQLNTLFDLELEAEARSRRDIDAVYVVAKDTDLNLIKPFIDVAINVEADAPKIFASSYSNSGNNQATLDLTGVTYSDIPFIANPNPELKANFEFIWEDASHAQKRLYALGMDAYALTHSLPSMKLDNQFSVTGQTGVLSIDERCVIERQLSWAEFIKPEPVQSAIEVQEELETAQVLEGELPQKDMLALDATGGEGVDLDGVETIEMFIEELVAPSDVAQE